MWKKTLALAMVVSGSLCAQELVKNGNFDQNAVTQVGAVPDQWQDKSGSWVMVDGDGFSDTFSMKFTAKKNVKGELRQTVDCKPGTAYQLKAAFKSEGAVPVIRILSANGKALAVLKADPAVKNIWQEYAAKFRTAPKSGKITVAISAEGEGQAKVDEISIVPLKGNKAKGKDASKLFVPPKGTVNLALNKPYTLTPKPKYARTRDDGDAVQLTDGKYTRGHFWTQKSTVGWSKQRMVQVMMDLGKIEPIQGFLYSCAGYPPGNVGYPLSIEIFTSNDQKEWYYLGDLWSKSQQEVGKPELDKYALYRAASMNMPTCARWICFQVKLSLRYTFADEIEVFKGDDKLLDAPPAGKKVASPAASFASSEFAEHFRNDADAILAAAKILPADQQKQLAQDFDKLLKGSDKFQRPPNNEFIPLLPLHPVQERIFAKNNVVLNALGYTKPMFWQNCRWDNLSPITVPPKGSTPEAVAVDMMPGEVRAETINLLNPTDKVIDYKVTVEGLPAEANLDCREVLFMDTKQNEYVASPLKPGQGSSVTVKIHPGTSRQIWFSFVKPALKAGLYKGTVKATADGAPTVEIPLHLAISKVAFPERPRLHIGGWDYLDAGGKYYHTPDNVKSNMAAMESIYMDSPWANRGVLPYGAKYDKAGHLLNPDALNYTKWDRWTGKFPRARQYCIHFSVRKIKWSGETPGTERFGRMVREYMAAFAKHLRATKKIQPEQVVLLLVDEPRSHEYDKAFITWAKAIKAADTGFSLVEDPIYPDPAKALPGLFDYSDILCPNYVYQLAAGEGMRKFYLKQRDRGKTLWLYACAGPSRLLDPVSYYRAQEWQCFTLGAKGAFYWAFGCGGGIGDSWHAYAQPGHEYSPYYVSKTDTMAAKQSEGIREGVEDYEYFSMLRDRVAELKKAGKSSPDIEAAEKLLNEEVNAVLVRYFTVPENARRFAWITDAIRWKKKHDRTLMDQVRIKALRLLEKLQ